MSYEQMIVPLALMKCHVPLVLKNVMCPWHLDQFTLELTL